jgi:hypothetical protein
MGTKPADTQVYQRALISIGNNQLAKIMNFPIAGCLLSIDHSS